MKRIVQVQPGVGQFYSARVRVAVSVTVPAGGIKTISVAGHGGVPAGVSLVALNVSASSSGTGFLVVYPHGTTPQFTTPISYRKGVWVQSLVWAKVGADGFVSVSNHGAAAVQIYADVHGFVTGTPQGSPGSAFVGLNPARIVRGQTIAAHGTYRLAPLGRGGVPATGVSHLVYTLTGVSAKTGTLTAYPSGTARPADTELDYYGGASYVQNLVVGRLGSDGTIAISNGGAGAVTIWVDVAGYFVTPGSGQAGSATRPLDPARILARAAIPAGGHYMLQLSGKGGVPATGAAAVALGLTVRGTVKAYLGVNPFGSPGGATYAVYAQPNTYTSGSITAKMDLGGRVTLFNNSAATTYVWADVYGWFAAPAVPAAPLNPQATAGSGQASVTWSAGSDNGSPITKFTITNSANATSVDVAGYKTSATVTGLTNGVPVTFHVKATNAVGPGPAADTTPVTPLGVPGAPTNVAAVPGPESATVSWSPPADIGGTAITSYSVVRWPGGSTVPVPAGQTSLAFSALTDGTAYTFAVSAVNAAGTGPQSVVSAPVTPAKTVPGSPSNVRAKLAWADEISVLWDAPAHDGGSPITSYTVTASPGGHTYVQDMTPVGGAPTAINMTGLSPGTSYTFTVTATNAQGTSPASAPSPAPVFLGPPSMAVDGGGVDAGVGQVLVHWAQPDPSVQGSVPIISYTITVSPGGRIVTVPAVLPYSTGMYVTITGLTSGTAYTFSVVATNSYGDSPPTIVGTATPQ